LVAEISSPAGPPSQAELLPSPLAEPSGSLSLDCLAEPSSQAEPSTQAGPSCGQCSRLPLWWEFEKVTSTLVSRWRPYHATVAPALGLFMKSTNHVALRSDPDASSRV
jgi:hypothetical protein